MINIYIVIGILFFHFLFDFVYQSDWEARNKSSSMTALLSHTITYSLRWYIPITLTIVLLQGGLSPYIFWFPIITFVFHTITDYFTSRLNTKLWDKGKIHEFFVSIGFDQFLHFTQLLLTFYFLK